MKAAGPALHVLMVLNGTYLPLLGGGTELQVRTLARALRRRGHRVTIVAPLIRNGPPRRIDRIDHTPVVRLPYPAVRGLGRLWLLARLTGLLLSRRNRYDVWHVHSPCNLAVVAALLGRWLDGPRVVVKVNNIGALETGSLAPRSSLMNRLLCFCLKQADGWQAISTRIAKGLAAAGIPAERINAIPNAVDVGRFNVAPPVATTAPRFLFIGRLVPAKNLFTLLNAFAAALQVHPLARLRIVGGGVLEPALKQCAQTLGITGSVEFTGYRADVEALMAQAEFGVLPSSFEGLSNTLLESMASGLPMIASRVSGSEDLVRTGVNGWLFEPDDCAALTRCLVEAAGLSAAQRAELGAAGRATVERYANTDAVVDLVLGLYRGAAAPPATRAPAISEGV